ncbi:phage tail protein [Cedecea davisae]|uniref:phage tail protein n=1 Tax=Cedecea davisae TaxID=158484 RepID=UPI00376F0F83
MHKQASLKKVLTEAVPGVATNPSMMRIFADEGSIDATIAASLSFVKRYTLNVIVTDYTGDIDYILVPVLKWVRTHQSDIMTTTEGQKRGFTWFADINNDSSIDISISLRLTERTIVRETDDGALHVSYAPEPQEEAW